MKVPRDINAIKKAIEEAQDLTLRNALKKTLKQLEKAGNEPAQRGRPGLDKAGNEPQQRGVPGLDKAGNEPRQRGKGS